MVKSLSTVSCWIEQDAGVRFRARRSVSNRTAAQCVDRAVLAQRRRRRACLTFSRWRRGGGGGASPGVGTRASARTADAMQSQCRLELCPFSPHEHKLTVCMRVSLGGDGSERDGASGEKQTGAFLTDFFSFWGFAVINYSSRCGRDRRREVRRGLRRAAGGGSTTFGAPLYFSSLFFFSFF